MAFTIVTKYGEKTFADKELVNISSKAGADVQMSIGFDFLLTVQYDIRTNKCVLLNQFNNQRFLFKGRPIPARLDIEKVCKVMVDGSDDFITIKVIGESSTRNISEENNYTRIDWANWPRKQKAYEYVFEEFRHKTFASFNEKL